jgi:hypothetical protein
MFFYSETDPAIWGANLPGSPVVGTSDPLEDLMQFVNTTQRWSEGTEDLSAVLAVDRGTAERVKWIFARNYFGSMTLSPFILEKCRLLKVATSLPRILKKWSGRVDLNHRPTGPEL